MAAEPNTPHESPVTEIAALRQRVTELKATIAGGRALETELRESEARFRQVTDTIDEVFWMTDPRHNAMFFISRAYERIWGRTCTSLIENPMSFVESIDPHDRDRVLAAFPRQVEGTYDIEYRIVRTDGGIRWIRDKAFPIKNREGEIYRVVGVAQDITDNKRLIHALRSETAKSARLLENILPKQIIDELKEGKKLAGDTPIVAQSIEEATVLFADVVGFTAFSRSAPAEFVVNQLNRIFNLFDELVDDHGVEKIKTIGDCYMLAAGVPSAQQDHADRVISIAMAMVQSLGRFNRDHNSEFEIRIGVHSGPVVAGVIGTKKYVYDIWGDTVNTASRMESHGLPGEIQVSEDTYRLASERFRFEERGLIDIKGRGRLKTYYLRGISSNGEPAGFGSGGPRP